MTTRDIPWLRRAMTYPSGIASGGGDTDFDVQPQETILTCRVGTAVRTVRLPQGTVILGTVVIPDPLLPSSAGTVAIDQTDPTPGVVREAVAATAYSYQAGAAISAPSTPVTTAVTLTTPVTYTITPASLTSGTYVLAGFKVILPRIRT